MDDAANIKPKLIAVLLKKENIMTKEEILALKRNRLETLQNKEKNTKCSGVLRKLRREIRKLENL